MKCLFPLDDLCTTYCFSPVRSLIRILKILFQSKVTYPMTNIFVELRAKISLQPQNLIHHSATVKQNSVLCFCEKFPYDKNLPSPPCYFKWFLAVYLSLNHIVRVRITVIFLICLKKQPFVTLVPLRASWFMDFQLQKPSNY